MGVKAGESGGQGGARNDFLICVLHDAETLERQSWQKESLKFLASSGVSISARCSGLAGGATILFHLQSGWFAKPDPRCDVTPAWTSPGLDVLAK